MRTTRFGRGLLLGLAFGTTLTAVVAGAWVLFRAGPPCDALDAETCLVLVRADEELAEFATLVAGVLGLAGPLLGLLWRDASRRAREESAA